MLSYDFHTHILPGIDDGAKTPEESLKLINSLRVQGIKNIVLTSHYYSHKESMEDFLKRREEACKVLLPLIPEDINVKIGAEVYVTKYMFTDRLDFSPVCMEGTPYMLTEFSYGASFEGESLKMLMRLMDLGVRPIIPHIERYERLIKKPDAISELIDMGVVIQSNASSFTDRRISSKLMKLLRRGYIHILSSDTHSESHNSPRSFSDAIKAINKKCPEAVAYLQENAEKIWNND